jgi:DNA-binding CsgD family transcriptional regulator
LTKRQSAILDLVGRGLSNKVIGFELGISEQVVKEYFSALLRRLGARNRGALGAAALARGVIGSFQVNPDWLRYLFREAPVPIRGRRRAAAPPRCLQSVARQWL